MHHCPDAEELICQPLQFGSGWSPVAILPFFGRPGLALGRLSVGSVAGPVGSWWALGGKWSHVARPCGFQASKVWSRMSARRTLGGTLVLKAWTWVTSLPPAPDPPPILSKRKALRYSFGNRLQPARPNPTRSSDIPTTGRA